jgi:serine/threonine-protein kinase
LAAKWVGKTLGRKYRVSGVLGKGGMGVVLEAENTAIKKKVAIKLLHANLITDPNTVQRFQREARTAASTGHEHIVEVYDMGTTADGAPFIVMELLEGQTLQKLLKKTRRLETDRACAIAIQVLSGLSAVHARGIVHRDLKPANVILIGRGGQKEYVKVVDFGISKIREKGREESGLTATGVVMGTPHYMSPEQARGEKTVDHRADLYAVGAMLYRCVAGRVPYRGRNYNQILAQILAAPPPRVRTVQPAVEPLLAEVIEHAMARQPERRYGSAATFAADLAEFTGLEISISGIGKGEVSSRTADSAQITADDRNAQIEALLSGAAGRPEDDASPSSSLELDATRRAPPPKMEGGRNTAVEQQDADAEDSSIEGWKRIDVPSESAAARSRTKKRKTPYLWVGGAVAALGVLTLALIWIVDRASENGGSAAARKETKARTAKLKPLRFGLGQHLPPEKRKRTMEDLAGYLEQRIAYPVEVALHEDFEKTGARLARGTLDLAYFSPLLYVKAKKAHPGIRILCSIRSGQNQTYQGLILARVDSQVRRLADLRGKRFCWVGKASTSGYLLPRLMLEKAGLDPESMFSKAFFTRYHTKALRNLDNGICDAAAVFASLYYRAKVKGKVKSGIRIVAATAPIPQDCIVAAPHLAPALVERVRNAFLSFDPDKHSNRKPLGSDFRITAFVAARDRDYASVREALHSVEKINEKHKKRQKTDKPENREKREARP